MEGVLGIEGYTRFSSFYFKKILIYDSCGFMEYVGNLIFSPLQLLWIKERLYAQLCSVYACFICGGNMFVTCCNQCNPIVFVMGFPFKLLEVASLRTVFFIHFPLCPGCYSRELNSCERTQSKQSLCTHTWELVEMTSICPPPFYYIS
jgi:hypothetical protein